MHRPYKQTKKPMNTNLESLNPPVFWKNFQLLCSVPRPSFHEEKAQALVMKFFQDLGYSPMKDDMGNILVSKPASPSMENRKGVILQAHLDMVPAANAGSTHNFVTDPITAYIDGDWVKANGTTLGADNGMGVAAIMTIFEDKTLVHGPLEGLITATEESGMVGAKGLKPGLLKGDILINLDAGGDETLSVGCAGGLNSHVTMPYTLEPASGEGFKLSVIGLIGGHSGQDIGRGYGNANKIMFRFLYNARPLGVRLASIDGGNGRNVIPREAFATVTVPTRNVAEFKTLFENYTATVKSELVSVEPNFRFLLEAAKVDQLMNNEAQAKLINLVCSIPNGVVRMSDDMAGLVETSNNLAVVKSENGIVKITSMARSSIESAKKNVGETITSICELAGVDLELSGAYHGWKFNLNSEILNLMKATFKEKWGREPKIIARHSGLECGSFLANYPNLDIIAFGPDIRQLHSPDERVNIASVGTFMELLTATLAKV
jgi:dipeptidase D